MIRLYIDEQEIELPSSAVVALTKRVANIGDFKTRSGSFTNKFTIQLNRRNRKALGLLAYNDTSRKVYTFVGAKLVVDGIELTANARMIVVTASDIAEVELKVLSGNIFDLLKKTKLRDLNLRAYDHRWNQASIVAAKANSVDDVFVYPIVQLGVQSTAVPVAQCKGLIPHVYAKLLLSECAARFGYSVEGSGYDDFMTDNLLIPIQGLSNSPEILADYLGTGGAGSVMWQGTSLDAITIQGIPGWAIIPIEFNPSTDRWGVTNNEQGTTWGGSSVVGYELLLPGTYTVRVDYDLTLYDSVGPIAGGCALLRRNGVAGGLQNFQIVELVQLNSEGTFTGSFTVSVTEQQIYDNLLNSRTYLYLGVYVATVGKLDYQVNAEFLSVDAPVTHFNRPITLAPNLPDWDMGRLFKEVAQFTGSTYDVDEYRQAVVMTKINDIDTNKANPYDWSDKLTVGTPPERRFTLPAFGQLTTFKYTDGNLYRHDIAVDNIQLDESKDYIVSGFIPVEQDSCLLIDNVASWDAWEGALDSSGRVELDGKPRILVARPTTGIAFSAPNQSTIAASGTQTVAYVLDGGELSLAWPDIYSKYYEPLLSGIIPDILVLKAQFLLTNLDIQTLDFSRPVWLKQYGALYYINEVSEFTGQNELTEVELVRIG
jgi:hypothetical protein